MSKDLYLFPNPVNHTLNVVLEGYSKGKMELAILDDHGREVLEDEFRIKDTKLNLSFPEVGSFNPGIYLLAVSDGESVNTRSFVKL